MPDGLNAQTIGHFPYSKRLSTLLIVKQETQTYHQEEKYCKETG